MQKTEIRTITTPVGRLTVRFEEDRLVSIAPMKGTIEKGTGAFSELEEYFRGERKTFTVPLAAKGTPFQEAVWKATSAIPYGTTVTYADIAKKIGKPSAVRAVGTALGANPVPIIVPCHRVVPSTGGIGQYAWGSRVKQALLDLEQSH